MLLEQAVGLASSRVRLVLLRVAIQECGVEFELAQRNLRRHQRLGTPHRCRACRLPGTSPSAAQIEEAKVWWLSRYTLDELRSWPMA